MERGRVEGRNSQPLKCESRVLNICCSKSDALGFDELKLRFW